MRRLLSLFILSFALCGAEARTTIHVGARVESYAALEYGEGYVEFTSNDPTAEFILNGESLMAGTYAVEDDNLPLRMADGWRPTATGETYIVSR